MSTLAIPDLTLKAAEERRRLHASIEELKANVRNSLDVEKQVREHLGTVCTVAAVAGFTFGYSVAGVFVRR